MPSLSSLALGVARIAGAQTTGNAAVTALKQVAGFARSQPVAVFGDADGDHVELAAIDAFRIEAAESSETSCSPLRPPKRMPTRNFFAIPFRLTFHFQPIPVGCLVQRLTGSFPECGAGQFHGEIGGPIVLVDDGVDFDDFEAEQAAVVGENLHGEVASR